MNDQYINATADLLPSELRFLTAMRRLGYCRFESLRIERGELTLDPWPKTVCGVLFGSNEAIDKGLSGRFELKRKVLFFKYVRTVDAGEIRCLEVRHGLPFFMEVEHRPDIVGGRDV